MASPAGALRTGSEPAPVPVRGGRPRITLITARGHDQAWLRARARALTVPDGDQHVSRSYCHPYGVLASHTTPVGIDIERFEDDDPALLASIATADERALGPGLPVGVTSLWSGKEALAKALGDARDYDPRRLQSPACWPTGVCGRWRARSLPLVPGHVVWIVWQEDAAHEA